MNTIYLCVIAEPWIEVIKNLESQYGFTPVHFVVWGDEKKKYEDACFDGVHIQTLGQAWKGLGFQQELKFNSLDHSELQAIANYELTALRMMDRLDPDGESFSFNARLNFFRGLVRNWLAVIAKNEVEVVISPSIPHRVFDYALYVAAKLRSVRFIMFQMISFESRSLIIEDIDRMPSFDSPVDRNTLSSFFSSRIKKVTLDYKAAIPGYELLNKKIENKNSHNILSLFKKYFISYKLLKTRPSTYWVKKNKTPQETSYDWVSYYLMKLKRERFVNQLQKNYNQCSQSFDFYRKKFVLVALHYQPEETTCPTGGVYADQTLLISLLNDVLPKDIHIVVKEHRSQFYTFTESASGRTLDFYSRALQISKRVSFVSVNDDPFDLIDCAMATVTVSGTIGWESAIRGTPAFVFGRAWYENMPRVFKLKTRADLQQAWKQVIELKNKDLTKEILDFHVTLEANSIHATHYKAYRIYDDVSMTDSVNNLVSGLASYFKLEPMEQ